MNSNSYKHVMMSMYLDYVNNYISLIGFAADSNMTMQQAKAVIDLGREFHEGYVDSYKKGNRHVA